LQNRKREALPKKPKPSEAWLAYPLKSIVIEFFWDWLAADFNPNFTPDGKPWLDQDSEFWGHVMYMHDLWTWAEKRAENPLMLIRPKDLTMANL
jgi:hypothetical protein